MVLTESQLKAIKFFDKPVMVLATAGSGKTMVLTQRILYAIRELNVLPENILAITFTNKATNEMRSRVFNNEVNISTIHSLCVNILRNDIETLKKGYNKDFEIINEHDQEDILKLVINSIELKSNFSTKYFLKCFSDHINSNVPLAADVKNLFDGYFKYCEKFNLIAFDDILYITKQLLLNPFILMNYQDKYKYIMVDEFQDVNYIQYQIIKMIAVDYKNIFVVGDDDQSIYGFRGSYKKVFQDFKNDFSPEIIYLEKNFRSNDKICSFANNLIQLNSERQFKKVYSDYLVNFQPIIINEFNSSDDEVSYVINTVKELISKYRQKISDKKVKEPPIAILYRNNFVAKDIEIALLKEKIPYQIYGSYTYIKRKEIQDILSYLKLIIDNKSFLSFKRVCNVPSRGIGDKSIKEIQNYLINNDVELPKAISTSYEYLNSKSAEAVKDFIVRIYNLSANINNMTVHQLYTSIITDFHYKDLVDNDEDRALNLMYLSELIKNLDQEIIFKSLDKKEAIKTFIDNLTLNENLKTGNELVVLSTIHSVKGCEFDEVFFVSFEDQFCPFTYNRELTISEIEEERRIAFVGITRARYRLYISYCKSRFYFGRYLKCFESRFLNEAIFNYA